jgi:hypothetical protein
MPPPYMLRVRHRETPPIALLDELRERLPGFEVTFDGRIVWFDGADTETCRRYVHAALAGLKGINWQDHFSLL